MKVYIVTREAFPYGMAAVQRIRSYAHAIQMGGLECEVVCFQRFQRENLNGGEPIPTRSVADGIPYAYMGKTPVRHRNIFVRKFNDWLDTWALLRYLERVLQQGDVVFFYGVDIHLSLLLGKLAHRHGAYVVRDLCELPYGTSAETRSAVRHRRQTLARQFPMLDGVVAISDTLAELARTHCRPDCRIVKVPIMVDFDKYRLDDRSAEEAVPYIFHSGTLYEQKDGILGVFEAFGKACRQLDRPVRFVSTGSIASSPHSQAILALIDKYGLGDKLTFTGYLSAEELRDRLSRASLVIINKKCTQQNHYCFSTKLGEYMAAAKPVIITRVGEAMNWLTDGVNAYIVEPEDTDVLAQAIVHAFSHPDEAKAIGQRGQEFCHDHFDYRAQSEALCGFLRSLSSHNNDTI